MGLNPRELSSKLLEDLESWFPKGCGSYPPLPEATVQEAEAAGLITSLTKKLVTRDDKSLSDKALELFLSENSRMKEFKVRPNTSIDEILLNETKNLFQDVFRCDDIWWTLDECFYHGKTGPGSSRKAKGTSFYEKLFSSPMSMTSSSLYNHYVKALEASPTWAIANSIRSTRYGELLTEESCLSFVPKTDSIARTICTEPSLNMFYQLGLKALIERKLAKVYGIDFSIQPDRNRRLTRIGSEDMSFSTIDLSSASDNFSLELLNWLLPQNSSAMGLFQLLRSRSTLLPNGKKVELHMVSTMGNGFTFPLQTLLFSCAVAAVYKTYDIKAYNRADRQNFAVFGDDIVVLTETYERLCHLLSLLGFKVNSDKSFSKGYFRESCGHDYFHGHNVRGVYIKDLSTQQARYSAINRLNEWTSRSGIPLTRTVGYLLRTVRYYPIPRWESVDAGVHVPRWMALSRLKGARYKLYIPKPSSRRIECPSCVRSREPCPHLNPEGALVSLLHGGLRNGRITPRQENMRYVLKTKSACIYTDTPALPMPERAEDRLPWDMAVWLNLNQV